MRRKKVDVNALFTAINRPRPDVCFTIPFPPSANHIWRMGPGRRVYKSAEYKTFSGLVALAWRAAAPKAWRKDYLYDVVIFVNPPDKRRRDIDNLIKPTLDALTRAGVWSDDSQIIALSVRNIRPGFWHRIIPAPVRAVVGIYAIDKDTMAPPLSMTELKSLKTFRDTALTKWANK